MLLKIIVALLILGLALYGVELLPLDWRIARIFQVAIIIMAIPYIARGASLG